MFKLATVQRAGVLDWFKRPLYEGDEFTAEADKPKTCYLRGGPLDGDEFQVGNCPPRLSVEKHYPVAAPQAEAFEEARTRTHRYRMTASCRGGFIYVYDGSV